MKKFLPILFVCCSLNISAQVFETVIDVGIDVNGLEIIRSHNGGYTLFVSDNFYGFGPERVLHIDSTGNVGWSKTTNDVHAAAPMAQNKIATYSYRDSSAWPGTIYSLKLSVYDSMGIFQSATTFPESLVVERMHPTADGGTIAIRENGITMMMKTDATGNFEWIKYIDAINSQSNVDLTDIIDAKDGGFIAIGTYHFQAATYSILIKLNSAGDTVWTKSFENFLPRSIYNAPKNGFLILSNGDWQQGFESPIIYIDSLGNIQWSKALPFAGQPFITLTDCAISSDSNFAFSGSEFSNTPLPILLKVDTSGNFLWLRKYPGAGYFYHNSRIINSGDSGFAMTIGGNAQDIIFIKTDSTGTSICDSLSVLPSSLPFPILTTPHYYSIQVTDYTYPPYNSFGTSFMPDSSYTAAENCLLLSDKYIPDPDNYLSIYPNPSSTQFVVKSPVFRENAILEIFNMLGEKIYSAGFSRQSTVDCQQFAKGIYIVRLSNFENQFTQKLVIN